MSGGAAGEKQNITLTDEMWSVVEQEIAGRHIRQIIVLDDGGAAIISAPSTLIDKNIVGVEHTVSGLKAASIYRPTIPIIEVASCAAKKLIEPPLIARAVLSRVERLAKGLKRRVSGAVGLGSIGRAIVMMLDALVRQAASMLPTTPRCNRLKFVSANPLSSLGVARR
jgi:hypothetical protein